MRWVTLFPKCTNVMLIKDVGMLPYAIYKKTGAKVDIACYSEKKAFPYINGEVKGINIQSIKKYTGRPTIDGFIYLLKNAKSIDILQLYHLTTSYNYWLIKTYYFLNPNGKVYLKLDTNYAMLQMNLSQKQRWIVNNVDTISAEILEVSAKLEVEWQREILYVPNGVYWKNKEFIEWENKENIILTVGRIGSFQKNTELLLSIFADLSNDKQNYVLHVIGPTEPSFNMYINHYFLKYPQLKKRVVFLGNVTERCKLEEEYRKAKIFLFSSRWESYGIVLAEALMAGCYIVSPKIDSFDTITDYGRFGISFPLKNEKRGAEALKSAINRPVFKCKSTCMEAQKYARENFNWENIIDPILNSIKYKK